MAGSRSAGHSSSARVIAAAWTRTSTCPGRGWGWATSSSRSPSIPPGGCDRTARIYSTPPSRNLLPNVSCPAGYQGNARSCGPDRPGVAWVQDMDFDEDQSQVRTTSGPGVMAALRNLAITLLRLTGATEIAAALRYHARRQPALRTIMNC